MLKKFNNNIGKFLLLLLLFGASVFFIDIQKLTDKEVNVYKKENVDLGTTYTQVRNCVSISPMNSKQIDLCLSILKVFKDNVPSNYFLKNELLDASLHSIKRIELEQNAKIKEKQLSGEDVIKLRYGQMLLRSKEIELWKNIENMRAQSLLKKETEDDVESILSGTNFLVGTFGISVFIFFYIIIISFKGKTKKLKFLQMLKELNLNYAALLVERDIKQVKKVKYWYRFQILNEEEFNLKKLTVGEKEILFHIYRDMWNIEFAYLLNLELKYMTDNIEKTKIKNKISKIIKNYEDKIFIIKEKLGQ
jgi:hypothetical protein